MKGFDLLAILIETSSKSPRKVEQQSMRPHGHCTSIFASSLTPICLSSILVRKMKFQIFHKCTEVYASIGCKIKYDFVRSKVFNIHKLHIKLMFHYFIVADLMCFFRSLFILFHVQLIFLKSHRRKTFFSGEQHHIVHLFVYQLLLYHIHFYARSHD